MSTTISRKVKRRVKKIPLGVRVEPEMKVALEKIADREKRSLTSQVEIALAGWLKTQGKRK